MRRRPIVTAACISVLLFSILACGMQPAVPAATAPISADAGGTITALAMTLQAVSPPASSPQPQASNTPTLPSTPTLTFTPLPPTVSVSIETNCRSGPGTVFPVLGVLHPGESALVVGVSFYHDNWIIQTPGGTGTCWLWNQYATVTGDTSDLPAIVPPPTPTLPPDFSIAYKTWGVGPGYECFQFSVTNTGGVSWHSYSIFITRVPTGEIGSATSNNFDVLDAWCQKSIDVPYNAPGLTGMANVNMNLSGNPAGDQFQVSLTLCTGPGSSGSCLTKQYTFIFH